MPGRLFANQATRAMGARMLVPMTWRRSAVRSVSPDVLRRMFHAACRTAATATRARARGGTSRVYGRRMARTQPLGHPSRWNRCERYSPASAAWKPGWRIGAPVVRAGSARGHACSAAGDHRRGPCRRGQSREKPRTSARTAASGVAVRAMPPDAREVEGRASAAQVAPREPPRADRRRRRPAPRRRRSRPDPTARASAGRSGPTARAAGPSGRPSGGADDVEAPGEDRHEGHDRGRRSGPRTARRRRSRCRPAPTA